MLLVTMVLHFFWQRHCDRQEGWDPALHRGEHAELDEKGEMCIRDSCNTRIQPSGPRLRSFTLTPVQPP